MFMLQTTLISKYSLLTGAKITLQVCARNDDYPQRFQLCLSPSDNEGGNPTSKKLPNISKIDNVTFTACVMFGAP